MKVSDLLLIWQSEESGLWLVACRRVDLIVQGRTKEEAKAAFADALMMLTLGRMQPDGSIRPLRPPPPETLKAWEEAVKSYEQSRFRRWADVN